MNSEFRNKLPKTIFYKSRVYQFLVSNSTMDSVMFLQNICIHFKNLIKYL